MEDRFKNFTVLLGKINRNIRRLKTEEVKDLGLKSPHVSCIYFLYQEKSLTSKQLTDMCEEDKASISRTLDFLEKNEYIKCDSSAKKRYRSFFSLTEKGLMVGEKISKKIDDILFKASSGLSEENRAILYQSLFLISDNLENIIKNN